MAPGHRQVLRRLPRPSPIVLTVIAFTIGFFLLNQKRLYDKYSTCIRKLQATDSANLLAPSVGDDDPLVTASLANLQTRLDRALEDISRLNDKLALQQEELTAARAGTGKSDGGSDASDVNGNVVAAVVVMTFNRVDYLNRTMTSVFQRHPSAEKFPLYISQDGDDPTVEEYAKSLASKGVTSWQHILEKRIRPKNRAENVAYYRIAYHYKFALDKLFLALKYKAVIILEDDMELSPDFFHYFEATLPLLHSDKTLIAISSWNDNGQEGKVKDPKALYRSDFFPGLGWMLTRETWEELSPIWPQSYWDDWLRNNATRLGRQSIRPEICRTYNFGEVGSSRGQFFLNDLASIQLNTDDVRFTKEEIDALQPEPFRQHFGELVRKAPLKSVADVLKGEDDGAKGDVRIEYEDFEDFQPKAKELRISPEWKDGVPRAAYMGVVVFWQGDQRVFLADKKSPLLRGH